MRLEATRNEASLLDEIRLLVEVRAFDEARRIVRQLRGRTPSDPDLIGLQVWIDHRRGAISEALDGWRELHDARPNGNLALVRLAQMRVEAGTPVERGDLPAVRRVLRLIAAGQNDRALAAAAQAGRAAAAAGDGEQRKLLALIEALLHELAGRPAAAAAVLGALGADPAFAHDVDRLSILARVCEQAGDRAGLQAAERVLDFLATSGILSAFPRLRQIRKNLGDEAGARAIEERWEAAFSRRVHRLDPRVRLAAATRRYVDPEVLARLPLPPLESVEHPQERGVRLLLAGDPLAALPLLHASPAWHAAALLRLGEREAAREQAAEALRREANSFHALLLADLVDEGGNVREELLHEARAILRSASTGPALPRVIEARARLASALQLHQEAETLRMRAAAAARRRWPAPGVVRAAAIFAMPGRAIGLCHPVVVRPIETGARREAGRLLDSEIHGVQGRAVRAELRRVFAAVREALEARWPERAEDFDRASWSIHFTKEDEPSGGPSLGLPAAMAFASALLDRPVSEDLIFTGAVSYDAPGLISIRPVGELGRKIEGTLHAGATALVFPATQRAEALSGQVVPPTIAGEVLRPVATFDEAMALAFDEMP